MTITYEEHIAHLTAFIRQEYETNVAELRHDIEEAEAAGNIRAACQYREFLADWEKNPPRD